MTNAELFGMSVAFTAVHVVEEVVGRGGPLWDCFGRLVGLHHIPWWIGFATFTISLAAALSLLAGFAYLDSNAFLLSVLLGCRVGDSAISHWGLRILGLTKPNPGIWSTSLYVVEAVLIVSTTDLHWIGVALGVLAFAAVLPLLNIVGHLFPSWI